MRRAGIFARSDFASKLPVGMGMAKKSRFLAKQTPQGISALTRLFRYSRHIWSVY